MAASRRGRLSPKRLVFFILLACVVGGGGFGIWRFMHKEPPVRYHTVSAARGDIRQEILATGTASALSTVNVGTQISGTVKEIYVDYNDPVKKGQLLMVIDPALQEADIARNKADLENARAGVLQAQSVLEDAERTYKRNEQLHAQDLIALQDLDTARMNRDTARAKLVAARAVVLQAQATLDRSMTQYEYTRIISPVSGVVIDRLVDPGQTVAASFQTPNLVTIAEDLSHMKLEVNVDEADIGGVKEGQRVEFTVDTYPQKTFEGRVMQIRMSPQTSTSDNVVTYKVIVTVDNKEGLLMPGMTANVALIISEKKDVIKVDNAAFRFRPVAQTQQNGSVALGTIPMRGPGGRERSEETGAKRDRQTATLYILRDETPRAITVERGVSDGTYTEIVHGLSADVPVVLGIDSSAKK